ELEARLREEGAQALAAAKKAQAGEVAALKAAHEEALARKDSEHEVALRGRSEELKVLQAKAVQLEQELEMSHRERAEALSGLLKGHEDQVALLQAAHKEALTRKDGEYQVALRRASDELSAQRTKGEQLEGELESTR